MKFFVISDVHGYFDEMKAALDRSGFRDEEGQLLLSCGDHFDRGEQNAEVFRYLSKVRRKILLRGNHEDRLEDLLRGKKQKEKDLINGTFATAKQFTELSLEKEVLSFISTQRNFYETEKYIFVHGWLPLDTSSDRPKIAADWRNSSEEEWRNAREIQWQEAYAYHLVIPGKTVVCGHRPAVVAAQFDNSRFSDDYFPFYGKGVIALDPFVTRSKKIYVVTLEDSVR